MKNSNLKRICNFTLECQFQWSVIKRPTDSTTSTASGQTDTTSGQTDTTSGQTSTTRGQTYGQTSATSEQTSTTSEQYYKWINECYE